MASREELLRSIRLNMSLDRDFFLRIYGYEITWPGFAEVALQRLEVLGCSRARAYYSRIVAEYEQMKEESMKPVAAEYAKKCQEQWDRKVGEEIRIRKESLRILRQSSMRQ